jgi:predicted lipoprotein
MQRRRLLSAAMSLGGTAFVGCHRPTTRERMLTSVAREVAAGMEQVMQRTRQLEQAITELEAHLEVERLERARDAFREAALTWKRVGTFRDGPLQAGNALLRATRSPARPRVIEAVLAESRPIDAKRIAELGSGEKGLYAIEYLLFDSSGKVALDRFRGPGAARARALALGLARELVTLGEQIQKALGRRGSLLEDELIGSPQRGLSRLVNTLIEGLEVMAEGQLGVVYHLSEVNRLEPSDVEGFASRISHRLALARLEGTDQLYRGGEHSVSALVRATAPNADASVRERFDKALAAMRSLTMPLEDLAKQQRSRLYEAYLKVKSLEAGMKVHLPSALGITITFSSIDAD